MALSPHIEAAIRATKARLVARFGNRLREMMLFGSYAWGEPTFDSDVDVCVIVDDLTQKERGETFELVAEASHDVPISPLVWSSAELQHRLDRERAIAQDITQRGIRL